MALQRSGRDASTGSA
ncbi:hypothetical protein [Hymenobacter canadensis]